MDIRNLRNTRTRETRQVRKRPISNPSATPIKDINEEIKRIKNKLSNINLNMEIDKKFEKDLQKIDGIGKKTAKDIVNIYPTEKALKEAINRGEHLPVLNHIEEKLKCKYSRK